MSGDRGASRLFVDRLADPADSFSFERRLLADGLSPVAGVDEAGRGPLAGPVVAGCVILASGCDHSVFVDSKKLSADKREQLFGLLQTSDALVGVGVVSAEEIDSLNILQASLEAMRRAVLDCGVQPAFLLVDGKFTIPMELPQQALVKGESRSSSIAAASIVAKVTRDRMMHEFDRLYPDYGFATNKGYPTMAHRAAIARYGPSPLHRRTFRGVREHVGDPTPAPAQNKLW
jgi:ribonuclease HII